MIRWHTSSIDIARGCGSIALLVLCLFSHFRVLLILTDDLIKLKPLANRASYSTRDWLCNERAFACNLNSVYRVLGTYCGAYVACVRSTIGQSRGSTSTWHGTRKTIAKRYHVRGREYLYKYGVRTSVCLYAGFRVSL